MRLVYIPGCWDLLHVGHVRVLQRASAFGDTLVVGVPSDDVVLEDKGQLPAVCLEHRLEMVQALRCVTVAAPYYVLEFLTHLEFFRPDVMAVGGTWGTATRHTDAERWCAEHSCRFIKLPYTHGVSSSGIKRRITNK